MAILQAIGFIVMVVGFPLMLTAGPQDSVQGLSGLAMIGLGLLVWVGASLLRL